MKGDLHVRFCEKFEVKFLLLTRLRGRNFSILRNSSYSIVQFTTISKVPQAFFSSCPIDGIDTQISNMKAAKREHQKRQKNKGGEVSVGKAVYILSFIGSTNCEQYLS